MKNIKIVIIIIVLLVFIIVLNTSLFKTKQYNYISIKYNYNDISVYEELNEEEKEVIKKIFNNKLMYKSEFSCGFTEDIAFELKSENEIIVLAIARDNCFNFKDLSAEKYISINEKEQKVLQNIFTKYNIKFPSI